MRTTVLFRSSYRPCFHGQGRCLALARELRIHDVTTAAISRSDGEWTLRVVAIEPAAAGWLWLNSGLVVGAIPYHERDNAE
jgi:hypothetical protein